jgi:DNA (cytosine-5)-methyltransferase 1
VIATLKDNVVFLGPPNGDRQEHLIDLFSGCGGSGGGLLDAAELMDRRVSGTFINHWDRAIEVHEANHPEHRHFIEDLFLLDPAAVFPVGTFCSLLFASPQCTFFSVARGAACVNEQDRSHAHSVTDWVRHLKPEAVLVENVPEFLQWSPTIQKRHPSGPDKSELMWAMNAKPVKALPADHKRKITTLRTETEEKWSTRMLSLGYQPYEVPDKSRAGEYFDLWTQEMRALGYDHEHRILKSCDFGDPTIRRRLYVYFVRKDSGRKIVWPEPYAQEPKKQAADPRPMLWRTARECINWDIKGASVFTRAKKLADNTFRRLAIGLVKYGLREFLAPNFGAGLRQTPRTHDVDDPLPTVTSYGAGGVVKAEAYFIPQHSGSQKDWVRAVNVPIGTVTTTMTGEGLVEPNIVQMQGTSTAQGVDEPLTAITTKVVHGVSQPMIDNLYGQGVVSCVSEPLHAVTASGQHQALAEAFMFAIDQSGGAKKNDGTYPIDEPVRTLVTKANQSCIEMEISEVSDRFLTACSETGVDTSRATTFLEFLVAELKTRGKVDAKPWIYVYYSSGSEGKDIDEPMPAVRTKAGHALVYPVIELNGQLLKIDLFYRMLTPLELQRAMGFPDDMAWAGCTQAEQVKAIGNSVSRGVSRALGLAWYSQDPDVWKRVKHLYKQHD